MLHYLQDVMHMAGTLPMDAQRHAVAAYWQDMQQPEHVSKREYSFVSGVEFVFDLVCLFTARHYGQFHHR
jgi:hypothetical protein